MATSRIRTPRAHDAVVFFLFFSVVNYLLTSFSTNRCGIFNALLDLLLGFYAAFDVLDDLDLFLLNSLLLSYLDLREAR